METSPNNTLKPLLGLTPDELRGVALEAGLKPFAARQMAHWLYNKGVPAIDGMTNISLAARQQLATRYEVGQRQPALRQESADGTVKYLFQVPSGLRVETVFIPDGERGTLCVSCQEGCKMGCRFCMTGRQGFHGNLTAADILCQIYSVPERDRLTNIVFMGQGEPFDNLDAVMRATDIITADYGWAWSPRRITVSTVGLRKGLARFMDESQCHLAVSLHNPLPDERAQLMPAEQSLPIADLVAALRQYDWSGQRRLSFEYIVFAGFNDTRRHQQALVRLLAGLECRVNLIRWHSLPGEQDLATATDTEMEQMRDYLTRHGLRCTIRASRGQDIDAACGLLNTQRADDGTIA